MNNYNVKAIPDLSQWTVLGMCKGKFKWFLITLPWSASMDFPKNIIQADTYDLVSDWSTMDYIPILLFEDRIIDLTKHVRRHSHSLNTLKPLV